MGTLKNVVFTKNHSVENVKNGAVAQVHKLHEFKNFISGRDTPVKRSGLKNRPTLLFK